MWQCTCLAHYMGYYIYRVAFICPLTMIDHELAHSDMDIFSLCCKLLGSAWFSSSVTQGPGHAESWDISFI